MVVFGGADGASSYNSDVWALSLAGSPAWSALAPAGSPPTARYYHTAIYDPVRDQMVVFGGLDAGSLRNDVWALSLAGSPAWSALAPSGSPPAGRYGHTAIYEPVRDRMVVFGGSDGTGLRNDVWALSLAGSPAWSALTPAGSPPPARYAMTAIYDPVRGRLVVSGRADDFSFFNDVWALSLAGSPAWSALAPAGSPPSARYGHTAIYDPVRDRMAVFGGSDGSYRNDVWALGWGTPPTPTLISLVKAEAGPDRVVLAWYGAEAAGLAAAVERHTAVSDWRQLAIVTGDGTGTFHFEDRDVAAGGQYAYRLTYQSDGEQVSTPEYWVQIPEARFALLGLRPNPGVAGLAASFTLPSGDPATLEVFDLSGRRIFSRDVGGLGPGAHHLELEEARRLPPGIYTLRLVQAGRVASARGVLIR
jgi:hypothetical protein